MLWTVHSSWPYRRVGVEPADPQRVEFETGSLLTTAEFFEAAVRSLDLATAGQTVAMVGDDLRADIEGAQRAGLQGWLVRTGKFSKDALDSSGIRPERLLDSVADLC